MALTFDVHRFGSATTAGARAVRAPAWRLTIDGADVTREITTMVTKVTYTDRLHGKSDDVEIVIHDSTGRWRGAWYPTKGDKAELWVGYETEALLPCGRFEIDEVELAGPPDMMTIRALASGVIPDLRTKRSVAYEGQSLRDIAQQVAARHTLTLIGAPATVAIGRVTQRDETDLTFLTRIAERHGYVFSVRDGKMIFYEEAVLQSSPPIVTINRSPDTIEYRIKDKTHEIFRACEVTYEDPVTKKTITRTVTADGIVSGAVHKINAYVENEAQALDQARAALAYVNSYQTTGTITVSGEPRFVAGSTVKLAGFGTVSGTYVADESEHTLTKADGYRTKAKVKRVS